VISDELRKVAAALQKRQPVQKTIKTAQVLEALSGLELLRRQIYG
jgi:hypothetical protein